MKRPPYFGYPPELRKDIRRLRRRFGHVKNPRLLHESIVGKMVPKKEFFYPLHPSIYLVPNYQWVQAMDGYGDIIGPERMNVYFSSYSIITNQEDNWVFQEAETKAMQRIWGINQLGCLTWPCDPKMVKGQRMIFTLPQFNHTRFMHSLVAAALCEVVLARNGFAAAERAPVDLAVLAHDIAMPAYGESGKRVDAKSLDEEDNFPWLLKHHGLDKKWKEKFGFDVTLANAWVHNKGVMGFLLDVLDKLSYTIWDCYELGFIYDGKVREHCVRNPLFGDVWQDIKFSPDRTSFAFTNPQRLYAFLMARALEHQELLLNPACRVLDFFMTKLIKPLYEKGLVTKEMLLTLSDDSMHYELLKYYQEPQVRPAYFEPDSYAWMRFDSQREMDRHCALNTPPYHTEHLNGFKTGLNWPVYMDSEYRATAPLGEAIPPEQAEALQRISDSCRGFYAYWYDENYDQDPNSN